MALMYDSEDGFYLAFSAGKDSQALYYVAKMAGVKFKAHMNFTSVDPPEVIRFKRTQYPDVVEHAPKKSIYKLAVERQILPSMRVRWCCADLKESAGAGKVTLIGIRKQESARRARRNEVEVSDKKFSGNLDEFEKWRVETVRLKEEKLIRKMKREGKKVNEDWFSAHKEDEVRCINGKDSILISPIFEWTEAEVWYFLNEVVHAPHCQLYDKGYRRLGCILCPMSSPKQKQREMHDYPHVKRCWLNAIKQIRAGGGISVRTYIQNQGGQDQSSESPSNGCRTTTTGNISHQWKRKELTGIRRGITPPIQSKEQRMDCRPRQTTLGGFSNSPSESGVAEGHEPTEDEIAEAIFNWWISGKSYERWYADMYLQQQLNFEEENDDE